MSTYLIRLELVFEPTVLFPPAAVWGGNRSHGPKADFSVINF